MLIFRLRVIYRKFEAAKMCIMIHMICETNFWRGPILPIVSAKIRIRANLDLLILSNISNYFLHTSTNCPFVSVSLNLIGFHARPFNSCETILRKIAARNVKSTRFELTKGSIKFQLKHYRQLIAVVCAFRQLIYIFACDTTYFRETGRWNLLNFCAGIPVMTSFRWLFNGAISRCKRRLVIKFLCVQFFP